MDLTVGYLLLKHKFVFLMIVEVATGEMGKIWKLMYFFDKISEDRSFLLRRLDISGSLQGVLLRNYNTWLIRSFLALLVRSLCHILRSAECGRSLLKSARNLDRHSIMLGQMFCMLLLRLR